VRAFSPEYLRTTREGMWRESRAALEPLALGTRDRVLDVGCGTGALSRVLAEETEGTVIGVDADLGLLRIAREHVEVVGGDAHALPLPEDAVDLVVCQALLVNLPDPERVLQEFARVAADAVAVIEPDNARVRVESTVDAESELAARARAAYRTGVPTDVALDETALRNRFDAAGFRSVQTRSFDHTQVIEPPYGEDDLEAVRRAASGAGIAGDRQELLAGGLTPTEFDELRGAWRAMGRTAIEQVRDGRYRRREVVPFTVAVADVPER